MSEKMTAAPQLRDLANLADYAGLVGFADVLRIEAARREAGEKRDLGSNWVNCPTCGEPDMEQKNGVIECVNLSCPDCKIKDEDESDAPPADDLVARCQSWANNCTGYLADVLREAAAAIEALRARVKALEEELRQTLSDIREKRSAANYRGFMKETDARICKALAAGGAEADERAKGGRNG